MLRLLVVSVAVAGALAGCGGKQSTVAPHSPQTSLIALLWWWMLGAAGVVFLGSVGMLVLAWVRRRETGLPFFGEREDINERLVVSFGIFIPLVVLVALFAAANLYVIRKTSAPAPGSTAMTVRVTGHQWWWEVRYPGTSAVTANEIHIPAQTRVNVVTITGDVIHSFWVPQLNRKIDMVPGRENRVLLDASEPGVYYGQCAEFCGFQHAHMRMRVVAEPPAAFRAWLANMAKPALAPATKQAAEGEALVMNRQCESCHEIRGTAAAATVGPDLTHLATRQTLAALTIPNTRGWLYAWIRNPQSIKPGARMPDLGLAPEEVTKIVDYLEGLH